MTTLIKNILLIDGSNQPPIKADVLIKGEKIAAIGSFPRYQADTVIDGVGAYLAPGFIDINTTSDRYLTIFSNPQQKHFLLQGITTIIGGQDGISLAPLLYGSLDLQKFWTDPYQINVDWHTVGELLRVLDRRKIGVNFGTLIGHSTIRHTLIGDEFRDLTQKELDVFQFMAERSLQEGAFGISFDLHSPVAALIPGKEIKILLETIERHRALASFKLRVGSDTTVYGADMKEQFVPSANEIINLSKETGVRAQLNNFAPLNGLESEYDQIIETIHANAATADVYFNLHPFERSVIPIVSFLPIWARRGGFEDIGKAIKSDEAAEKIKKELIPFDGDDVIIYDAPGFDHLVGRTIKGFGEDRGLSPQDALIELMRITGLRSTLLYHNLSLGSFDKAILSDRSIIASSGASFADKSNTMSHVHIFDRCIPKFFELSGINNIIPIETAVRKITSLPAQRLGIKDRGMIKEGYYADLVLFRDATIETVFVNGAIAVRDGVYTDMVNGTILRYAP